MWSRVGSGFISARDRVARHSRVSHAGPGQGGACLGSGALDGRRTPGARRPSLSATEWLGQDALDREQLTLDLKAARVPADAPAGVEHAMAGHDDRERI